MKTRPHDWYDTQGLPKYGIQIRVEDGRWLDVGDNSGIELYDTPKERDRRREELRRKPTVSLVPKDE